MKDNIYFDNASSSQLSEAVFKAMTPFLQAGYGNPSSLHKIGVEAKSAISKARQQVADVINSSPKDIIFTSGGTESTNLAILGVAQKYQLKYQKIGHIITSKIEHEAVLEPIKFLEQMGWKVTYLPVDKFGVVSIEDLKKFVRKDTVLVSVMYANNETGTIQPIEEIGKSIAGINRARNSQKLLPIYFHSDACQAGGLFNIDVQKLKLDLLTLNGSKINGPKGSGILYKKSSVELEPQIRGGGQENGFRSGTENTPAIVGFGEALKIAKRDRSKNVKKLSSIQTLFENLLAKNISGIIVNGPKNSKLRLSENNFGLRKLPSTVNFSIEGVEGEALMYYLDSAGFCVATGSACTTSSTNPSHVLLAMGVSPELARSTIRVSFGYNTNKRDVVKFVSVLSKTVEILKKTTQEI